MPARVIASGSGPRGGACILPACPPPFPSTLNSHADIPLGAAAFATLRSGQVLVGERELWNAADSNAIVVKVLVHGDSEHRVNLKVCLHVQVALCFACLRLALLSTHFKVKPTRSVGEFQLHHDAALCSG